MFVCGRGRGGGEREREKDRKKEGGWEREGVTLPVATLSQPGFLH